MVLEPLWSLSQRYERRTSTSSRPRLHAGNSHPVCGRRPPTPTKRGLLCAARGARVGRARPERAQPRREREQSAHFPQSWGLHCVCPASFLSTSARTHCQLEQLGIAASWPMGCQRGPPAGQAHRPALAARLAGRAGWGRIGFRN